MAGTLSTDIQCYNSCTHMIAVMAAFFDRTSSLVVHFTSSAPLFFFKDVIPRSSFYVICANNNDTHTSIVIEFHNSRDSVFRVVDSSLTLNLPH